MSVRRDFLYNYYRNVDLTSLWEAKMEFAVSAIRKGSEEERFVYFIELYSNYLQFVEIFCLNIFAISEHDILGNLFAGNKQLREKIAKRLHESPEAREYIEYYLRSWVFPFKEAQKRGSVHDTKINLYKTILLELIKDYLQDYQLLNAYKHGHRIYGRGESSFSIGLGKSFARIGSYNALIAFFYKEEGQLYRKQIHFNWERVQQKYMFLLNMLSNTQELLIDIKEGNIGKERMFNSLNVTDEEEFRKYFGFSRWIEPVSEEVFSHSL